MTRLPLVVLFVALSAPALAGTEAEDRAQFAEIVRVCTADAANGQVLAKCVTEQVDSLEYFLGDLLAETGGYLDAGGNKRMAKAHAAWQAYVKASCDYQAKLLPAEPLAFDLCRMRLVEARTIELRAFNRYADPAESD